MDTMPATLWVPLLRSRSWPPPWRMGWTTVPSRTTRAPTPLGPPNLWALIATRSAPAVSSRPSSQGTACTASVCTRAEGDRWRTTAVTDPMGCTVPISLFTVITDTRPTSGVHASARASRSMIPSLPVRTSRNSAPVRRARARQALRTAWCSMAEHTSDVAGVGEVATIASHAPATARLSASVPPEVNTTSPGSAPSSRATWSRASSTARRARRDSAWLPDGFPKLPDRKGSMASTASGRIGVVAAWSK